MKSVHLTNAWHAKSGGIRTFYSQLMAHAPAHDHYLRMVVPGEHDAVEEINSHARVYYVRSWRAPFNREYRMLAPQSYLLPRSPVARILQREQPDLVEFCDKYSLPYLGGLLRVGLLPGYKRPVTVTAISCERLDENVEAYLIEGAWVRHLSPVFLKWLYFPLADHHIAVSHHTAGELEAAAHGHKVMRGVWLGPMGVDLNTFSPALRTRPFGDGGRIELLYAGRLVPEKNAGLLLDTMAALGGRPFRLRIAGDGIERASLERRAAAMPNAEVEFLGHVSSRAELARLIANADIFVHPNPREPFGIAPLEAMASGTPLVAPDSGGVTTYAHALNAWLSAPEGPAFAGSVRSIVGDAADRERRINEALATAGRYSWPSSAARFFELYRTIHAARQGKPIEHSLPALFYSTPGDSLGRERQLNNKFT